MVQKSRDNIQLLTGNAHTELAKATAKKIGIKLTPVDLGAFANGEIRCKLTESVRGCDVFIMQSHVGPDINRAIIEQLIMIDAAKRASANSITAVCPFLAYARQDRKASGREAITTRLVIDMFSVAGADRIMSIDLHSGQSQGFFNGPFDHLIAAPVLKEYIKENLMKDEITIVSPDAGRVKSSERYASSLNCPVAVIHKQRVTSKRDGSSEAKHLIGEIEGRNCIIIDDMIDTAGTICAAADLLKERGAKKIFGVSTHGIFSDPALERIEKSAFDEIIVTDTLPVNHKNHKKIKVLSVAPLLASAITAVYDGMSVSALFDGQNQM